MYAHVRVSVCECVCVCVQVCVHLSVLFHPITDIFYKYNLVHPVPLCLQKSFCGRSQNPEEKGDGPKKVFQFIFLQIFG